MRPIRTVPPKDEREYPLVITAEEKDKVLNYILVVANGKRTGGLLPLSICNMLRSWGRLRLHYPMTRR